MRELWKGTRSKFNTGLVPRAIEALFAALEQEKANDPEFEYTTTVSFLDLYNEDLVDLLAPREIKMGAVQSGPTIREIGGKIVWSGIKEEHVASPKELFECVLL